MALKHTIIQGDSYAYDFSSPSVPTFDGDWSGTWGIVDVLGVGNNVLATGALAISTDSTKLEMRIAPADTDSIPVGSYILVVEITNSAAGFNQEVMQDKLTITAQGV